MTNLRSESKKKTKQYNIIKYIICFVIVTGVLIMSLQILFPKSSAESWLGFYGGYLGAFIGVLGAVVSIKIQMDSEQETRNSEKIDNTFFNLLTIFQNIVNNLESKNTIYSVHLNLENNIKGKKNNMLLDEIKSNIDWILEERKKIINQIRENDLPKIEKDFELHNPDKKIFELKMTNEYEKSSDPDVKLLKKLESTKYVLENNKRIIEEFYSNETAFKKVLERMSEYYIIMHKHDEGNKITDFIQRTKINEQKKNLIISNDERNDLVEKVFEQSSDIHSFFRMFHRIVKYLNENVDDSNQKSNYIGFLRAILDEDAILIIFYNTLYSKHGKKLKKEIFETSFFGNKKEISSSSAPHFSADKLFWKKDDLILLKENTTYEV